MKRMARPILSLGIIAITAVACRVADAPTAPVNLGAMSVPGVARLTDLTKNVDPAVRILKRKDALTATLMTQMQIGPAGGVICLPKTGLVVTFPEGAVATKTTFVISAKPGRDVSYEFQPHYKFAVPVIIQQDLKGTEAQGNGALLDQLGGAYFSGALEQSYTDASGAYARVKELRAGSVDNSKNKLTFTVDHFSGYLASSGRQAPE